MNTTPDQKSLDLYHQEILEFKEPLYYRNEKTNVGVISQLALEAGDWSFAAVHKSECTYKVTHDIGISFLADLKEGRGTDKGTYKIKGCVQSVIPSSCSYFDNVKINGVGDSIYIIL